MARCRRPNGSPTATPATTRPTSPRGTGWSPCWAVRTSCTSRTPSCVRGPRWATSPAVAAGSSPCYPAPAPRTPPSGTGSKPTPRTGPKPPAAAGAPASPNRSTPRPRHHSPRPRGTASPGSTPPPKPPATAPPAATASKPASPPSRHWMPNSPARVPDTKPGSRSNTPRPAALAQAHAARWVTATVTQTTAKTYKQARRGRPGPETSYREITTNRFALAADIALDHVAYDAASDGCFPLITNDRNLSDAQVLAAYRYQPNLERRHHLLKSVQDAAPVLLKNPARIEALFCCQFLDA